MKQRVRGVRVLKTNTNAIIFGPIILAITPVFCALLVATGASALSLPRIVKDITTPVTDILPKKSTPVQPASAPASIPSDDQQAAPPISNAALSTADTSTNVSQLVEYGAPLEPMPVYTQDFQQLNVQPRRGVQPILARSLRATQNTSFAFLQPSEQGWKIFGTPWYLWALVIVTIVGAWWWIAVQKARHLMSLAFWR